MKPSKPYGRIVPVLLLILLVSSLKTIAQETTTQENSQESAINIFIDDEGLDMNYVREQMPYANFVRDTRLADVYIRETRESAGSGGRKYTYIFEGQNEFANMNDTLTYSTSPDNTSDETREGRTNMLKMGLIRYVAKTPLYDQIQISSKQGTQRPEVEAIDNWNNWVFEVRASPKYESESRKKTLTASGGIEASKVTPDIKVQFNVNPYFSTIENKIYNTDEDAYEWRTDHRNSFSVSNLTVFSITDHWSWGGRVGFSSSTRDNYDARVYLTPSIEYNLFPYSESTHHQLRMMYGVQFSMNNYADTTVYLKTEENLVKQSLDIAYRVQEKWGYANFSIEASNYFHDWSKNRIEVGGSISYRITTGLSANFSASYAWIYDQLSLAKGDASVEEVLLGLVQLPTSKELETSFGLTYTFGSIYNNVVNPRFGSGRW